MGKRTVAPSLDRHAALQYECLAGQFRNVENVYLNLIFKEDSVENRDLYAKAKKKVENYLPEFVEFPVSATT